MQLLPPVSAPGAAWAKEKPAGDHLPYLAQIDENTLLLRDGRLMQVLTLDGLLFETADTDEINYRKALRDAMLQAIGTSRFALYHHIIRRRVEPQLDADIPRRVQRRARRQLAAAARIQAAVHQRSLHRDHPPPAAGARRDCRSLLAIVRTRLAG